MWAQVKAVVGWQAELLVVEREGRIAGGCQLLIRSVPVVGAIAYAPRGPVIPDPDMAVVDVLLAAVHRLARRRRILYLALQPPPGRHDLASALKARGFVESALEIAPERPFASTCGGRPRRFSARCGKPPGATCVRPESWR